MICSSPNLKSLRLCAIACVTFALAGFSLAGFSLADSPSTQPAPTLKELAAKIHQINDQKEKLPKVAVFDLHDPVVEKPSEFTALFNPTAMTLRTLIDRLHKARDDKDIRAVLVTLGEPGTNLSQSQEIRDALLEIRKAGKKVYVYADGYDTDTYTIASGATSICILPGGEVMIPGVSLQTMYLKGLFDKLGVKADYVQIGKYKGAQEPYTRTGPSDEFKGELDKLTESLYKQVVAGIASNRNMSPESVRGGIDQAIQTAAAAKDRGFVDHLVDPDGLRDLIGDDLGTDTEMVTDYGATPAPTLDLSNPFALLGALTKKPAVSTKPAVALVFADGVIVDGDGGASLTEGSTIGSDEIRRSMRDIAADNNIKCVVIRINSPGGSAVASEAMWQAVRRVGKTKPVIISVGNMAASGGYYLASAGERIFADPSAIVGSIGVVGGKFVTKDLYDKLGISTQTFSRGKNSGMFSNETEFTEQQRKMVQGWMTETYDQFTDRVMTTRGGKIRNIDDVAQGRVFIAEQAKELGLVDDIGGLDSAILYAASMAELKTDGYEVRTVPAPRSILDLISTSGLSTASPIRPSMQISETSILKAMPKELRSMVGEQLEILRLLQERPVVLAAPFAVRER
jgi:protease-4